MSSSSSRWSLTAYHAANVSSLLVQALLLAAEEGVNGSVELISSLEEVELHHEDESEEIAAELLDKVAGCLCCAACNLMLAKMPIAVLLFVCSHLSQ